MKKATVFNTVPCPDADLLFRYSKNEQHGKDVHQVESHILSCSLCSDAIEGMKHLHNTTGMHDVQKNNPFSGGRSWIGWLSGLSIVILSVFIYQTKDDAKKNDKQHAAQSLLEELPVVTLDSNDVDSVIQESLVINYVDKHALNDPARNAPATPETGQTIAMAHSGKEISVNADEKPAAPAGTTPSLALPVKYIYDLKVIDYAEVYERIDRKHHTVLKGIPASKEGNDKELFPEEKDTITSEMLLNECLQNFNKGNYKKTILLFKKLTDVFPDDLNALFYSGVSYYELKDYGNAVTSFKKVIAHRSNVFTEEAQWYLALSKISSGEQEEGKKLLKQIAAEKGFYADKAQHKLKTLP